MMFDRNGIFDPEPCCDFHNYGRSVSLGQNHRNVSMLALKCAVTSKLCTYKPKTRSAIL
jgi:hypothetical protein